MYVCIYMYICVFIYMCAYMWLSQAILWKYRDIEGGIRRLGVEEGVGIGSGT